MTDDGWTLKTLTHGLDSRKCSSVFTCKRPCVCWESSVRRRSAPSRVFHGRTSAATTARLFCQLTSDGIEVWFRPDGREETQPRQGLDESAATWRIVLPFFFVIQRWIQLQFLVRSYQLVLKKWTQTLKVDLHLVHFLFVSTWAIAGD